MSNPSEEELRKKVITAQNTALRNRRYRRGRERALTRLAQAHREEYLELLAEEKAKDEQEGKGWSYDTRNPVNLWSDIAKHYASKDRGDTSDIPQDKGNDV